MVDDDLIERGDHTITKGGCGQIGHELFEVGRRHRPPLLAGHIRMVPVVVLGDALDDRGRGPVVIGQRRRRFPSAPLGAHIDGLERFAGEKRGHGLGLTVTELGQARIGALGVVVDPVRLAVPDEYEIHSGRA